MPDIKAALTRKIGPLPAWGWGVVIGGGIVAIRVLRGGGASSPFVTPIAGGTPYDFDQGSSGVGTAPGPSFDLPGTIGQAPSWWTTPPAWFGAGAAPEAITTPRAAAPSIAESVGSAVAAVPVVGTYVAPPPAPPAAPKPTAIVAAGAQPDRVGAGATAATQAVAAKVATATATAVSQLASRAGVGAAEASMLVRRVAPRTATSSVQSKPPPARAIRPPTTTKVPTTSASRGHGGSGMKAI